ncbi:purine-nucleoside phosphorylase [Gracilibacillus ureilyticus]|uniref:Purine nucleoside phosphorylase n=1 Tax=Gracilibacillus ureilyticus TaxID=531814 RepID=A0A1H9LTW5_9BACI|nr:purine-nucleoside phosphorylase [Gracilibacillus ureilyticus]SER14876.1 purine-nucleoside phosphorylase [Gracilibacillus ureilyticus]
MNHAQIEEAVQYIQKKVSGKADIGLILGSGLGVLAEELVETTAIDYEQIPHFPVSTVEGHSGRLVFGKLEGVNVVVMQGRFHYYEGYSLEQVTFPVRVFQLLGIEQLIVTNAAGGINESFSAGDLMIITDHINNLGSNPLIGRNEKVLGERFPDMSQAYDRDLIEIAKKCADKVNIAVKEGTYVANTGPSYETPAEVRMLRRLGGDAVGMSTVPEVIIARHAKMRVLGISCISNMAAGILDQPLSHEEVIETTEKVKENFIQLVRKVIQELT